MRAIKRETKGNSPNIASEREEEGSNFGGEVWAKHTIQTPENGNGPMGNAHNRKNEEIGTGPL